MFATEQPCDDNQHLDYNTLWGRIQLYYDPASHVFSEQRGLIEST